MSRRIGVALIGCGYSGCELHAPWYKDLPEMRLIVVADSNTERAQKAAERFGAETFTNDWREAVSNPDVEIVDINVPPSLNKDITVVAAETGKHVLCEKPMATSLKDADEMIAASEKNRVKLMIAHVLHFFPEYAELRKAVSDGVIGRLCAGNAIRWLGEPYFPFSSAWDKWYGSRELGGGSTFSMQIHDIDFLKTIFGEVHEVLSVQRNFTHREFTIDDFASTTLFFGDDRVAMAQASWASPSPFTQQLDLFGDEGFLSLRTGGRLTSIGASRGEPPVTAYFKDGTSKSLPTPSVNGYYAEIKHFVSCVIDDKRPMLDPHESRETLKVTLAALESARSGRPVKMH